MILYRIIIFCACAHGWHSLSLTLYQILKQGNNYDYES